MDFFKGLFVALVFCIAFWVIVLKCTYDWGYKDGVKSVGYKFETTQRAFAGVRK